ncbi:NADH dehydrogenase [ubiquinone] iron-sulfur protein 3, mitochondrial-like [Spodoptera frugiperda]|uniref:NADH dehydrogenase [ubiquinone] iron-sulfur protein 3, mitochondrial n=1 Tax=Spodoptera frugiperda TaxID=7108 RepID=A0A9R0DD91_SPOFR|nr:NADH dehydrogenase [ubiquinone] iron-sulfur protein 3, mitochondrial-like [Spodoptera frugiperda]
MNYILSGLINKNVTKILKRNIYTQLSPLKKNVQVKDPFFIEPIEYDSLTLRKHDNPRRQMLYEFGIYVATCLPKYVQKVQLQHTDELEILVAPAGMYQVLSFLALHQHACFGQCSSATAIDVPGRQYRFEVEYDLLSFRYSERVRVKTYTDELTPLKSAYGIWKACQWYEREIYDMYGVVFTHHPDLRRLLTDYGFTGHPLRKDFPLVGYIEIRYDDELKKIVYEPVEYAQEARKFELQTPWHYLNKFHEGYDQEPPPAKK